MKSYQKERPVELKSISYRIIVVELLTNLSRKEKNISYREGKGALLLTQQKKIGY